MYFITLFKTSIMRTFYVVHSKLSGMKELKTEATNYLGRVGAVVSNKELSYKTVGEVAIGDVMFSPEHGFNFEVVVIK